MLYTELSQILFFVVIRNDFLGNRCFDRCKLDEKIFTAKIGIDFSNEAVSHFSSIWNLLNWTFL